MIILFIVIVYFIFSKKENEKNYGEDKDENKRRIEEAKKAAKKLKTEIYKPPYSIVTMLGIQEFVSDEKIFIFFKIYNKFYDEKQKTKNLKKFVDTLYTLETEKKIIFKKNIEKLFAELSENKNDKNKKVETSAFQMYFLSSFFCKGNRNKNGWKFCC